MKKILLFTILLLYHATMWSQSITPSDIIGVCSNQSITNPTPTGTKYNNLITHCSNIPLTNTLVLYYVEIMSGTTFTFSVTPTTNVDYDFATWLNPDINNLGPADRGSQNSPLQTGVYTIGLSLNEPTETCELPSANISGLIPGMVRYYDVQPGDAILIAINRWSTKDSGFTISFGGDAILSCNLLDKEYRVCDDDHDGKENFDLSLIAQDIQDGNNSFSIDFFSNENDAKNPTATNTLPLNHTAYTASNPNSIYARIKRPNGILRKVMKVDLIVNKVPIIKQQEIDLEMCDYDKLGELAFDLTRIQATIANGQTDLNFKYYENKIDAQNNNGNIIKTPKNYVSGEKTVYAHVDIDNNCPRIVDVNLILNEPPVLNITTLDYELCEKDYSEKALFDLTSQETVIANGQNNFSFKYYENLIDAEQDNNNYIGTPKSYSTAKKTVYARVSLNEKCAVTVNLNLIVNKIARITSNPIDYEICDNDLDGLETFDLLSYESIIAPDQPNLDFKYYTTLQNAEKDTLNLVKDLDHYTSKKTTLFVRITVDQKCPTIVHLNLIPNRTKITFSETSIPDLCGEVTQEGLRYDLTRALPVLLQGEKAQDYKISYHHSEDEAQKAQNAISDFKGYVVPYDKIKTVYVRFEDKKSCYIVSNIILDSKRRFFIEDQYNRECDPFQLPILPPGYHYYTQPNGPHGEGDLIDLSKPENSLIYGKRIIYIYATTHSIGKESDAELPDTDPCIYETRFTVYNNDCKIPKGISPNGDGKNDSWDLTPFGVTRLLIYNRWGNEVYHFNGNYINEWEGQSTNGTLLPDGTYWYSIDALNGKLQGWVQIMR